MPEIRFPFDTQKFFEKCVKNKNFPRNDLEKQVVLLRILEEFSDEEYSEDEINDAIRKYFHDHALIRREFINFKYMKRDPSKGVYWVVKRTLSEDDVRNNTLLRRHAKAFKVLPEDK